MLDIKTLKAFETKQNPAARGGAANTAEHAFSPHS
jgi:hypothetical protein